MKLNIPERLTLVNMLPEKGNFETMTTIDALQVLLYPSEKEVKEFEIKSTDKSIMWNAKGTEPVEIEFTESQTEYFKDLFKKKSEEKELTLAQYHLHKKFKENKESKDESK